MERTVPEVVSEEIELYLRTAYSLLRASTEVRLRSLEEAHAGMNSLLHPLARHQVVDSSAFIYSILRLPKVITEVELVVLGQTYEMFLEYEIEDSQDWQEVRALARRRRCFFNVIHGAIAKMCATGIHCAARLQIAGSACQFGCGLPNGTCNKCFARTLRQKKG